MRAVDSNRKRVEAVIKVRGFELFRMTSDGRTDDVRGRALLEEVLGEKVPNVYRVVYTNYPVRGARKLYYCLGDIHTRKGSPGFVNCLIPIDWTPKREVIPVWRKATPLKRGQYPWSKKRVS